MEFVEALKKQTSLVSTENGGTALKTTSSDVLDFFSTVGAMRGKDPSEVILCFSKAVSEDKVLGVKSLFYARDIREGIGERETFKVLLKFLAFHYPEIIILNRYNVPNFGRWDDLYALVDTPCAYVLWETVCEQLKKDIVDCANNKPISLLAKWLKSPRSSSLKTRRLAMLTAKSLCLSEEEYRKILSRLRSYLNVTETQMSKSAWGDINYSQVPSRAMNIYRDAFFIHDQDRFNQYISNVQSGFDKINSGTLFPYDIVEKLLYSKTSNTKATLNSVLEAQWKALPNFVTGENDVLVMADVSGSMYGRPMATAIGLAIYFAERNQGAYKDIFMTFSANPELVQLKGNSLLEKVRNVSQADWGYNTDMVKAMRLILDVAIQNKISPCELPKSLIVISDMQFDSATNTTHSYETHHHILNREFAEWGYCIPNIIYWNVDSRSNVFQVTGGVKGVQFASGASTSVFKTILDNIGKTPYEAMLSVLNNDRYDCILFD